MAKCLPSQDQLIIISESFLADISLTCFQPHLVMVGFHNPLHNLLEPHYQKILPWCEPVNSFNRNRLRLFPSYLQQPFMHLKPFLLSSLAQTTTVLSMLVQFLLALLLLCLSRFFAIQLHFSQQCIQNGIVVQQRPPPLLKDQKSCFILISFHWPVRRNLCQRRNPSNQRVMFSLFITICFPFERWQNVIGFC